MSVKRDTFSFGENLANNSTKNMEHLTSYVEFTPRSTPVPITDGYVFP